MRDVSAFQDWGRQFRQTENWCRPNPSWVLGGCTTVFLCVPWALPLISFAWEVTSLIPAISLYAVIFRVEKKKSTNECFLFLVWVSRVLRETFHRQQSTEHYTKFCLHWWLRGTLRWSPCWCGEILSFLFYLTGSHLPPPTHREAWIGTSSHRACVWSWESWGQF